MGTLSVGYLGHFECRQLGGTLHTVVWAAGFKLVGTLHTVVGAAGNWGHSLNFTQPIQLDPPTVWALLVGDELVCAIIYDDDMYDMIWYDDGDDDTVI